MVGASKIWWKIFAGKVKFELRSYSVSIDYIISIQPYVAVT